MDLDHVSSITGLTIQLTATVLVTILLAVLTRSVRRTFLDYWTLSGGCLGLALMALLIAFLRPGHAYFLYPIYFFGEYAWAYLMLVGCRNLTHGGALARRDIYALPAGIFVALLLPQLHVSFNLIFAIHSAVLAIFFTVAAGTLVWNRDHTKDGAGLWMMFVALGFMTLVFLHYVPLCAYAGLTGYDGDFPHLRHSSIYDMMLQILLAFGMVMVAMESVRRELEKVNYDLGAASLRLQVLAQEDSLTESYNRHAFYTFVEQQRVSTTSAYPGCVAVLDVNNLKQINDTFGHQTGDAAIRAVARAIRFVIRADDLLFRWGGDEFLILWPNIDEEQARRRLEQLNPKLRETILPGFSVPVQLRVAYGIAEIEEPSRLDAAIHHADSEMYTHKQVLKVRSESELEMVV